MAYVPPGTPARTKGKGSRLTDKMSAFVDEYFVDLNASKAVLRAGYKTKPGNENRMATELLNHPLVKQEIENRKEKRRMKHELSADLLIQKLISIMDATEESNPMAALRAIELAGKSLALWKERQEISGPDGKAIEMEQRVTEDVADFTSKLSRLAESSGAGKVVSLPKPGGDG